MTHEAKTLTAERIRKEKALATLRELQLAQLQSKLLPADKVQQVWGEAILRLRNAVLAIPSRCAAQFADPRHAEQVIRRECETALKQIASGRP